MLGFVVTFAAVRGLTYSIHAGVGPFHNVSAGGTHIHHMVWGIILLLAVGYIRLLHDQSGTGHLSGWQARVIAAAYGVGAALTLDEFALWLNFRDVYWQSQGWESISAGLLFAVLMLAGIGRLRSLWPAVRKLVQNRANLGIRIREALFAAPITFG
jgi:hypothetical protein